jgi:NitT/TauT family transport system substrate-binding protein
MPSDAEEQGSDRDEQTIDRSGGETESRGERGKEMRRAAAASGVLVVLVTLLAGCGTPQITEPPDEVTVQLAWVHQYQFAGYYAAEEQGYYTEEGLKVTLLSRPEVDVDVTANVVDGLADFGVTFGAGVVVDRSLGRPVTAIAAIYRRHPLVFMTLAESGITRPQDFPGHTIRTLTPGGSAIAFEAMMTRLGMDPDSVEQIDVGYDLAPFFARELDIWLGYLIGEVLTAREQGQEVNLILPDEYGIHLYGDTLFASDQLIRENPDLVLRFLRATLRGWQWAIQNPQEAGALALKYDSTLDAAQQAAMMEASVPLVYTGEDDIGWMRAEVWEGMYDILSEQGLLGKPFDVNEAYTMEFLQQIDGGEQ